MGSETYLGVTRLSEVLRDFGETAALRYGAKLNCAGQFTDAIRKGWSASQHAETYREMGESPDQLVQAGLVAIRGLIAQGGPYPIKAKPKPRKPRPAQ